MTVRPAHWIALAGLMLTLQGATFAYVLKVEARLTRLETFAELQAMPIANPRGPLVPAYPASSGAAPRFGP